MTKRNSRSEAARRGWETRRRRAAELEAQAATRSAAAKKGWQTRAKKRKLKSEGGKRELTLGEKAFVYPKVDANIKKHKRLWKLIERMQKLEGMSQSQMTIISAFAQITGAIADSQIRKLALQTGMHEKDLYSFFFGYGLAPGLKSVFAA